LTRYNKQIEVFKNILNEHFQIDTSSTVLDLGCGAGVETAHLAQALGSKTVGIDIHNHFDPSAARLVELQKYDGHNIPFPDDSFDVVYSFHVLEHVENLVSLLQEVHRVLKPNGVAYFGTPNKQRVVGYFGMKDKTLSEKLRQNLIDWKFRLMHRFENEYGAHAGFTDQELKAILLSIFPDVRSVTLTYYRLKWPGLEKLFISLDRANLLRFVVPSIYMFCYN